MIRILLLLTVLLLAGCCTPVKPEPEIRYKTVIVAPADNLLVDCDITPPPAIDYYVGLPSWTLKEGVLVDSKEESIKDAIKCNVRWKALREWKAKQLEIYKDKNPVVQ